MDETSVDQYIKVIAEIAVEEWRFRRTFERIAKMLDDTDSQKFKSQYSWFSKKVEAALNTAGLRVVNFEQQDYDAGMPVFALNLDDFEPNESLVVTQMIEPVIMADNKVQKTGTVILRRREGLIWERQTVQFALMTAARFTSGKARNRMTSRLPRYL